MSWIICNPNPNPSPNPKPKPNPNPNPNPSPNPNQGLSSEWELDRGQMQLTINQLRAQIAEAKAAHEVQLVEARREEQGRGEGVETHGQRELAALPAARATDGIVQVACLAAELRLEEITAVAAREEAERQREAARMARAELRTQMQMLRAQVATSTEADARLVELEEEVAAGEAQLVGLRAKVSRVSRAPTAAGPQRTRAPTRALHTRTAYCTDPACVQYLAARRATGRRTGDDGLERGHRRKRPNVLLRHRQPASNLVE